jgi:FkbM family methyltransferase
MRTLVRASVRTSLRTLVSSPAGLRLVNAVHARMSPSARQRFFYLCCDESWRVSGEWTVDFAGRRLVLPLTRAFADAWLAAIGFHGYDPAIHALYEALVRGPRPPRVVFDVGANYGLHALRFLVHGARVLAFEPNPECHRWFRAWCAANGVRCELDAVAVADAAGTAVLTFPQGRLYLGTIMPAVRAGWGDEAVRTLTVRTVTLDDVVADRGVVPDLVKIDTEGSELAVLRGAAQLLRSAQPTLVFEAWHNADVRHAMWRLLARHGYDIAALDGSALRPLTRAGFVDAQATDFVAEVPPGRVIHSARQ